MVLYYIILSCIVLYYIISYYVALYYDIFLCMMLYYLNLFYTKNRRRHNNTKPNIYYLILHYISVCILFSRSQLCGPSHAPSRLEPKHVPGDTMRELILQHPSLPLLRQQHGPNGLGSWIHHLQHLQKPSSSRFPRCRYCHHRRGQAQLL